jgi:hypothetical protein
MNITPPGLKSVGICRESLLFADGIPVPVPSQMRMIDQCSLLLIHCTYVPPNYHSLELQIAIEDFVGSPMEDPTGLVSPSSTLIDTNNLLMG